MIESSCVRHRLIVRPFTSQQFIFTRRLLIPLRRYFFPPLSVPGHGRGEAKILAFRDGRAEGRQTTEKCRVNVQRAKRKENNKERRKNRPDGNCNNITLDQASTYPHPKWWFGIIFFRSRPIAAENGVRTIAFLADDFFPRYKNQKRVISGWMAEAAECDGCCWMRGKDGKEKSNRKENRRKKQSKRGEKFLCSVVEFHFLLADQ